MAFWAPLQPATVDPSLYKSTRYRLRVDDQFGVESKVWPNISTYDLQRLPKRDPLLLRPMPYPLCHMLASLDIGAINIIS